MHTKKHGCRENLRLLIGWLWLHQTITLNLFIRKKYLTISDTDRNYFYAIQKSLFAPRMNHTNLIHKKKSSQIVYSISVYVQKEIKNESSSVYVFDTESSVSWNIQAARFHTSSSGTSCNKNLNLWCKQTEAIQPDMYQHQLWRGIWFLRENISSFAQHRDTAVRSRRRFLCLNESVTNITKYQKINAAAAAHVSQRGNRLLQAFSFITHDPNLQKEASCIFSKQCSTNRSSASTSVSHRAAANSL